MAYKAGDQLNLMASYAKAGFTNNKYWKVGASYAFTKHMSVNAEYSGSQAGDEDLQSPQTKAALRDCWPVMLA